MGLATCRKLYLSHIDADKVDSAVEGLEIRSIRGSSPLLPRAYGFLARYFPVSEYDPLPVWRKALVMTDKSCLFSGFGHPVFLKYLCFVVIDKRGRYGKKDSIIAYADGTFEGDKKTNAFYLAHIAVCAEARRHGIGTALVNAVLAKCNEYASHAEACLRTKYKIVKSTGLKLQFMILDIEFVSMHNRKSMRDSVSRLVFHGVNGVSVCSVSDVRYAQSDTRYGSSLYKPEKWLSLPMFFGLRPVGREKIHVLSGSEVKALLGLMYSGFLMCMNHEGVSADHSFSISCIRKKVDLLHLPGSLRDAVEFVERHGDIYKNLKSYYRNHNFTVEYGKRFKPQFKPGDIPLILK